jgi:hypothetical protein
VAQTGGQILFAFLLTIPFSPSFASVGQTNEIIYVVTLLAAAVATALLIAPVAYHRWVFRQGRKPELVKRASAMAQGGLAALLLAFCGAVFLVLDVVVGVNWAVSLGIMVTAVYSVLWYVLPALASRDRV